MKILLRLLLKSQHQNNRTTQAQTDKGMTLIELLIGMVMAFLIITPMLAFVVDMLNTDRREQVKANTEQDIQAAVDFIAQDLSQAIYIYDGKGVNDIRPQLPEQGDANKVPILVFWKRQQIRNAVPVNNSLKPNQCEVPANAGKCNDTYVQSLVAYYQIKETNLNSSWCQPSSSNCPTRITRYEIQDGIKNPYAIPSDTNFPYYETSDTAPRTSLDKDAAFNKIFNLNEPTKDLTITTQLAGVRNDVLVNYIDHTNKPLDSDECQKALGNPQTQVGLAAAQDIPEDTLKVTDGNRNSFYACVDTSRNLARVTIRGNSLRRLQDSNITSSSNNSAFFPTVTVQVQGRGALGR
jgi:type II secretory pathway pseudopilin PulG